MSEEEEVARITISYLTIWIVMDKDLVLISYKNIERKTLFYGITFEGKTKIYIGEHDYMLSLNLLILVTINP